jgi:hypothetical protein
LDTYQAERHPVGKSVLRSSGGIVRLAMAKRPWTLALRAALTTVLNRVGPARRMAAGRITGIGYAYGAPRGSHALVGTRVPDIALKSGRLYEALRGGRFVLVTPQSYGAGSSGAPDVSADHRGHKDRKDRLTVESWAGDRRTALLVRPDGYVAWAAESPDSTAVEAAVTAAVGG